VGKIYFELFGGDQKGRAHFMKKIMTVCHPRKVTDDLTAKLLPSEPRGGCEAALQGLPLSASRASAAARSEK
jgi:hypothetical protein